MRPDGVVFDLDGTLVDSRADLASSVNVLRGGLGLPPLPVADVTRMVGDGARMLVRRALPATIDGEPFEAALARFLDVYFERCLEQTRPYPGIEALVAALAPRYRLAVLTNKPERHSRRVLAGLELLPSFDVVLGGDSGPARKPDAAGVLAIATQWQSQPSRLLLVGDSGIDAATAVAAGTPLALVSWGYGRPKLAAVKAWRVDSPAELLAGLA